jgi:RNA polymerase subunit RPABC4/transcription elongation factor Spt4
MSEKPKKVLCTECSLEFPTETDDSICPDCLAEHSFEWREAEAAMEAEVADEEADNAEMAANDEKGDPNWDAAPFEIEECSE